MHKNSVLEDLKCICGEYLDIKSGKYGVYFSCIKCGNISAGRVFEINNVKDRNKAASKTEMPRVITTTSDDPRFFD